MIVDTPCASMALRMVRVFKYSCVGYWRIDTAAIDTQCHIPSFSPAESEQRPTLPVATSPLHCSFSHPFLLSFFFFCSPVILSLIPSRWSSAANRMKPSVPVPPHPPLLPPPLPGHLPTTRLMKQGGENFGAIRYLSHIQKGKNVPLDVSVTPAIRGYAG